MTPAHEDSPKGVVRGRGAFLRGGVKRKPAVVAVASVGLLLAACTGDGVRGDGTPRGETPTDSVAQALDPDREAPAVPIENAVAGGTVTVLANDDPGLDPTTASIGHSGSLLTNLLTRSLT